MPRHSEVLILINIDRITVCFILKKNKQKLNTVIMEFCNLAELLLVGKKKNRPELCVTFWKVKFDSKQLSLKYSSIVKLYRKL